MGSLSSRSTFWLLILTVCFASQAKAQGSRSRTEWGGDTAERPRHLANLRLGASTAGGERPEVCMELSPLPFLAVEGCGSGAGFLHQDTSPEMAHFRAKGRLASWKMQGMWLEPQVSAGFAELQLGKDESGFHFSSAGPSGVATAGPEVGASLRVLLPLANGVELVGDAQLNAAWMAHAPELQEPKRAFQPSASVTMGVGW